MTGPALLANLAINAAFWAPPVVPAPMVVSAAPASIAPPPTLADGLRAVGALEPVQTWAQVEAPAKTGSTILLSVSGAAVLTGVVGYFASAGCQTRDAARRCVDAQGSAPIFGSLIVLGLGGLATGAWWHQRLPVEQR